MELDINKLNKNQKEAVAYGNGPVLIVAGAGTGKTRVITDRIAYLIDKEKAKPEEILAMTFTEKAAEEMEERVDKVLPVGYIDLWISTFHSFCRRVLEEHGLDIGLATDFKLLDDTDSWLLIRQNLERFKLDYYKPRGNPSKFIKALISHFSHCKDQAIYPEDYLKYSKKTKSEDRKRIKEVANAYQEYQNLLLENGLLDFGDLINYCLKLFKERPLILEKYRNQFKYILVDEFQDTNWAQYELIKLLAEPKNNLFVCADSKQAIYRFRGASFGNIVQFRKDFPKAKEIILVQNYRSSQNILDLAFKFIQLSDSNKSKYIDKIDRPLSAARKDKAIIEHLHFRTFEQELRKIVDKIIEILKQDKEACFSDFGILARTNESANAFSRTCERAGIPCQFVASKGLYSKPIILDIISYFKLLDNYHESSAVYRILNLPFLNILAGDIAKITHYGYKKSKSTYEVLEELSLIAGLSENTIKGANKILSLVKKHTKLAVQKNVSEIFLIFLEDFGYLKYLVKNNKKQDLGYISQFHKKVKEFEEANIDPRMRNFMEELNLELESGEPGKIKFDIEQGPDMVKIMTIHTAKGLEFKYVFLISLVDKKFPSINRSDQIEIPEELVKDIIPEGDIHLEEERRLFYVAMTRAKKGLFFTSAEDYGGMRKKRLSRFLTELGYNREVKEGKAEPTKIIREKPKEKTFLPSHFSYSQLCAFGKCPLQYKYTHILRIPRPGKASFSFGKTIHNALDDFLKEYVSKKCDLKKLLEIYEKNWIDDWYESKTQKNDYYESGKKILKDFYNDFIKQKSSILFINNKPALEQDFYLKINGYTIKGRIDRIDKIGDRVEIIDYKTGIVKDKLKQDEKEQLLIYQIAAEKVFGLNPEKLTYYFLDKGRKLSFLGSEKDKKKQEEKIIQQIEKIKKSDFKPTPGWQCKSCDFKNICEYAQN